MNKVLFLFDQMINAVLEFLESFFFTSHQASGQKAVIPITDKDQQDTTLHFNKESLCLESQYILLCYLSHWHTS